MYDLERFITAQNDSYQHALEEIRNCRKTSHWMWFVFPQIDGLGHSETTKYFAISDLKEAEDFLAHPVLGRRLVEISRSLMEIEGKSAREVMGKPDDRKLQSSMTLFSLVSSNDVFERVLEKYFAGEKDRRTLEILELPSGQ